MRSTTMAVGDRYGHWTVTRAAFRGEFKSAKPYWMVAARCDCGHENPTMRAYDLRIGRTQSCNPCQKARQLRHYAETVHACKKCGGPCRAVMCHKCAQSKTMRRVVRCPTCEAAIFYGGDSGHVCPPSSATSYMRFGGGPPVVHAMNVY